MDITNGLTLSKAVKDKDTPLRKFLVERFPNTRGIQQEYKAATGELVVDSMGAPPTTMGTAMDLAVRSLLDPTDVPQSARILFRANKDYTDTVDELSATAGAASQEGPAGQEAFARAIWGLALCVEAHRAGMFIDSLVPKLVFDETFDVATMSGASATGSSCRIDGTALRRSPHIVAVLGGSLPLGTRIRRVQA
jgi:hypothetical protein